jgi:hypothetical protein
MLVMIMRISIWQNRLIYHGTRCITDPKLIWNCIRWAVTGMGS